MSKVLYSLIVLLFLVLMAPITAINTNGDTVVFYDTTPVRQYSDCDIVDYWTKFYSLKYDVPEKLMISMFYKETRYLKGDTDYIAGIAGDGGRSFGVGQVQLATAKKVWSDTSIEITRHKLTNDIRFNIETSVKLVAKLRDMYSAEYKDERNMWKAVLTTYNRGHINGHNFNAYAHSVYNDYIN